MNEARIKEVTAALGDLQRADGRRQFTAAGKAAAVEYAKEQVGEGGKLSAVAAALSLNAWTLQRWVQLDSGGGPAAVSRRKPGFARVKAKPSSETEMPKQTSLVVYGGRGVRVEGLTLENVVALLERLAC